MELSVSVDRWTAWTSLGIAVIN